MRYGRYRPDSTVLAPEVSRGGWVEGERAGAGNFLGRPKVPTPAQPTHTITPHSKKGCLALPHTFSPPLPLTLSPIQILPYKSASTSNTTRATGEYLSFAVHRHPTQVTIIVYCIVAFVCVAGTAHSFFASFSRCRRPSKLFLHRDKCCAFARGTFDSAPSPFPRVHHPGHAPRKRASWPHSTDSLTSSADISIGTTTTKSHFKTPQRYASHHNWTFFELQTIFLPPWLHQLALRLSFTRAIHQLRPSCPWSSQLAIARHGRELS